MHINFLTALALGIAATVASGANAAPIYVGVQAGNGGITGVTLTAVAGGGYSFAQQQIGSTGIYASGTVEGTPPLPEPSLISATTDLSGSHNTGGTVSIYMTETNQFPSTFNSYFSKFLSTLPTTVGGVGGPPNTAVLSVTESIYQHNCALPAPTGCNATTDVFNLQQLIASVTFNPVTAGSTYTSNQIDQIEANLTTPYAITEVYSVTFAQGSLTSYGDVQNSISMSVPEPLSVVLLGTGLLGLGIARRRRH